MAILKKNQALLKFEIKAQLRPTEPQSNLYAEGHMTEPKELRKTPSPIWIAIPCLLMVLATFHGNTMWLVPGFLLCGAALFKESKTQNQKIISIVACLVLALGAIGLQLGKSMAVRDNVAQVTSQSK